MNETRTTSNKSAAVRLFRANDAGSEMNGWRPVDDCLHRGLANPRGWAALHVVVQKLTEGRNLHYKDLYDQMLIVENPGAVVVCREDNRVGLVQNYRFTAERLATADPGYVKELAADSRWDEVLESLGKWHWELPRGLAPEDASCDLEELILKAAKIEAREEAGFTIEDARICGRINPSTTFFAHAQYVVDCRIKVQGENNPEQLEMIGQTKLFNANELRELIASGQLEDGLSLGALYLAGFPI